MQIFHTLPSPTPVQCWRLNSLALFPCWMLTVLGTFQVVKMNATLCKGIGKSMTQWFLYKCPNMNDLSYCGNLEITTWRREGKFWFVKIWRWEWEGHHLIHLAYRSFSLTWSAALHISWNKRFLSIPTGFSWYTNIAAVSLFWYTNMAAVTSCVNDLYFH